MIKNTLKTASVLAFERKLSNSDAVMHSGSWDDRDKEGLWNTIEIQEKAVRGTISNRQKTAIEKDPAKLDAEVQKANLQRVDVAALPFDSDTMKLTFTLRILGDLTTPSACNNQEYQEVFTNKVNAYIEEYKFEVLANRYAENIANGRFLWRNRVGAEEIEVRVYHIENNEKKKQWTFNCKEFNVRSFTITPTESLCELGKIIQDGLIGKTCPLLKVEAFVRLGAGQEVFPSQELILDKNSEKSKVLYQVNKIAAMHSQKIGNALRTIDTWYADNAEIGPIAVEPFGSVTNRGCAYRQPKDKIDFYTLLDGWMLKDKLPDEEQQHYVIANLIRGGVFGAPEKKS